MKLANPTVNQTTLSTLWTTEVSHRSLLVLLAVVVGLLHIIGIIELLQPIDKSQLTKPPKIVEVVLVPKSKPKIEKPDVKKTQAKQSVKRPIKPKTPTPAKPVEQKTVERLKIKPVVTKPVERPLAKPVQKVITPKIVPAPVLTSKASPTVAPHVTPSYPVKNYTPSVSSIKSAPSNKAPVTPLNNTGQDSNNVNSGIVEVFQAKPSYPMQAKSRRITGWVKVAFTVTASGEVTDAHVIDASPAGIFNNAALAAIQRSKFKPKISHGKPVSQSASKTFKFDLT